MNNKIVDLKSSEGHKITKKDKPFMLVLPSALQYEFSQLTFQFSFSLVQALKEYAIQESNIREGGRERFHKILVKRTDYDNDPTSFFWSSSEVHLYCKICQLSFNITNFGIIFFNISGQSTRRSLVNSYV